MDERAVRHVGPLVIGVLLGVLTTIPGAATPAPLSAGRLVAADQPSVAGQLSTDGGAATGDGVTVTAPAGAVTGPTQLRIDARTDVPAFAGAAPLKSFSVSARRISTGGAVTGFTAPLSIAVATVTPTTAAPATVTPATGATTGATTGDALSGADQSSLRLAALAGDGTWSLLATGRVDGGITAAVDGPGTFAVVTLPAGGQLSVGHYLVARVDGARIPPNYLATDTPVFGVSPWQSLRLRFRLDNPGLMSTRVSPQLEYRPRAGGRWVAVAQRATPGSAWFMDEEWREAPNGGTQPAASSADIPSSGLLVGAGDTNRPIAGHHSMAANPDRPVTVPAGSYTEQEFTVGLTADALDSTGYEFRITNAGAALPTAAVALVTTGPRAAPALSPGQLTGVAPGATRYPLAAPASGATPAAASAAATTTDRVHGPYSMTADQCAVCHRSHTASAANLTVRAAPQKTLCFTCHDGTGGPEVETAFTTRTIPSNNAATREYYGHDVLSVTAHDTGNVDEFGGVSNRHSECGDCHNPHQAGATTTGSVATPQGWSISGALAGVSGVSVVNGAAGSSPTYTFLDGVKAPITAEYQLCLKCHSGFTVLPSNTGYSPSRYTLDKGVEFNPNNPSYHPVEAAGTNQSAAMAASLAGTSPYKQWNFTTTSTIRCVNCHADGSAGTAGTAGTATGAGAGASAPAHRSANRGILLANYRDRVLKPAAEPYAAADFALCYLCHAESPFVGDDPTSTNFRLHGEHVSGIGGSGSGGMDIDTPGAGQGNALCAECHFRIHSVSYPAGSQTVTGSRLVNFAPNVTSADGVLSWTSTGASGGSCTLTCHGKQHIAAKY